MPVDCPHFQAGRCRLAERIYAERVGESREIATTDQRCARCLKNWGRLVTYSRPLADVGELVVQTCQREHPAQLSTVLDALAPQLMTPDGKPRAVQRATPQKGPGTFLKQRFQQAGWPSCQFCDDLADDMNRWGATECRQRIDEIVKRIAGHAPKWVEDMQRQGTKVHWLRRALAKNTGILKRPWIRHQVTKAIEQDEHRLANRVAGIAVVIPCHNYGAFLAEAIESVLAQTLPAVEIVVVDDASTDDTAAVAAAYADRGVRYLRVEFHSVLQARQTGCEHTSAPLICFLDADDWIDSDYLESAVELLEDPQTVLVHSDRHNFGDESGVVKCPEVLDRSAIDRQNQIHAGAVVRRDALEVSRAFAVVAGDQSHADWKLWRAVLDHGGVSRRSRSAYQYRRHTTGSMLTEAATRPWFERMSLASETVSLLIPLAGRQNVWPTLAGYLERQTWPHDQIQLHILDTSQNAKFGKTVRRWLADSDYTDARYQAYGVGRPGLADEPRSPRGNKRDVQHAMLRIWRTLCRGLQTRFTWTLEDDIQPPDDVLERLLKSFDPSVDAVAAPYWSRYSEFYCLTESRGRRVTQRRRGVQPAEGSGFGCLVVRSAPLAKHVWRAPDGVWYDPWFFQSQNLRLLIDWSAECAHHDIRR